MIITVLRRFSPSRQDSREPSDDELSDDDRDHRRTARKSRSPSPSPADEPPRHSHQATLPVQQSSGPVRRRLSPHRRFVSILSGLV